MATIKSEQYIWNKGTSTWDLYYHRTSADLIVETASYKVLTTAERTQISDYLTSFNVANKLVQLNASGQITVGMIPGGLDYLPLAGGTVTGDLNIHKILGRYIDASNNGLKLWSDAAGGAQINIADSAIVIRGDSITFQDGPVSLSNLLITNLADPVSAQDAANKRWVEQLVAQGTHVVAAVRAGSTGNITTLSGLLTIDGITLVAGDRVLVKNQTTVTQNGVYIAATGAWTKVANDSDQGSLVSILFGTTQTRHQYYCSAANTWILYFIDDSYYAAASGGLELEADGFGFKISAGGVTNAMLAGSIAESKLAAFTNVDNDTWASIASAATSAGLGTKLTDIFSAIKNLRGTANYNTSNTQTIADLYTTIVLKNRIMYGSANPPAGYTGEDGDVYLKAIV